MTIRKEALKNARCKIEFNPPYSLESGSTLRVELVQSSRLPKHHTVLAVIEFTVKIAQGIFKDQQVLQLSDHLLPGQSAEFRISFSMEPTATSVLDRLGKYSKFLQTVLALALAASEANSIAKAVFASVDQIYKLLQEQNKCDEDITALLQDMTDVLACIADVEQFAKSAQLKQAMAEVHPILRATVNFITQYSTQSLTSRVLSLTLGLKTRDQLDKLTQQFASFKYKFDRGLAVQSGMTITMTEIQLKSLLDSTYAVLRGHLDAVTSVAFSPDGTHIVSGSNDNTVRVWDAETQTQIGAPLEGHTNPVTSVAFSPDGTRIVSGSDDRAVHVWDTKTQTQIRAPLEGHKSTVTCAAFSPDGTRIISGSDDRALHVWDTETQTQIRAPLKGHTNWVNSVAFSPDGTQMLSGSGDSTMCVWDAKTQTQIGAPLKGHTSTVTSVAFSPDGTHIVSGSGDNTVCVWDAKTQTQIGAPLKGHKGTVTSVAFSPDGTCIVSGSSDKTVHMWDAETQTQIGAPLEGHTDWVWSVAFSPDGTRIVSGSEDNTVRVWDTETQTQSEAQLEGHRSTVTTVAFSPDGTHIVSGSDDNTVRVWDAETQRQIGAPLEGHTSTVNSVAFSPDGTRIVSGSDDNTVHVWDTETRTQIGAPLAGHKSTVTSVAFSPDGTRIISGSHDNTIGAPLAGHTSTVTSVAFSPDGTRIISGSDDRHVHVWDTETQTPIRTSLDGPLVDCIPAVSQPSLAVTAVFQANTGQFDPALHFQQDSWIVGPHGELILWVPHHLMNSLPRPNLLGILGTHPMITFDTSKFYHGDEWIRHKTN
ncbi:WD40-repeat-containing domain protein [Mycena vulgaris]|nr:WD40-repeat-containing domain protein [Mycena vulgaris]